MSKNHPNRLSMEEREQLRQFYDENKDLVWKIIRVRGVNEDRAWDLFQEVFERACQGWKQRRVHGRGADIKWISTITHRVVSRYYKTEALRYKRIPVLDPTDEEAARALLNTIPDRTAHPEEILENNETIREIAQHCLAQLPEDDLTILLLKYSHGFSYKQIAKTLGIRSEGAARTRTHRAKGRFKEYVIEETQENTERIAQIVQLVLACLEEQLDLSPQELPAHCSHNRRDKADMKT